MGMGALRRRCEGAHDERFRDGRASKTFDVIALTGFVRLLERIAT